MTWPGLIRKQPYRGLTAWLPRDYYDPGDPHAGRPAVVIKVLQVEKACIVVTRTSQNTVPHRGDIYHDADPKLPCCGRNMSDDRDMLQFRAAHGLTLP